MGKYHDVQQGECLSRIAKKFGFTDYRTIYNHPQNARLRQLRPNPHLLFPGDRVYIPDKGDRQESRQTGQTHRFVKPPRMRVLRIVLQDGTGQPMANASYALEVGKRWTRGTTNAQGLLEEEVPLDAESGTLRVGDLQWPLRIGHLNPVENCRDGGISGTQARLSNLGYDPGPIDGIEGPRTRAAVRAFQRDNGLTVDGICGPLTRAKLVEKHGC